MLKVAKITFETICLLWVIEFYLKFRWEEKPEIAILELARLCFLKFWTSKQIDNVRVQHSSFHLLRYDHLTSDGQKWFYMAVGECDHAKERVWHGRT